MNKKEYLKQGLRLKKEISHNEDMLQALKSNLDGLQAIKLSEKVQGGTIKDDSAMIERMDKIIELEKKIKLEKCQLTDLRNEILEKLRSIKNSDEKILMESRYYLLMSWEEIADKLCYSLSHTYTIHGRALKNFEIIENSSK